MFCCSPQSLIFSNIYGLYRRITHCQEENCVWASFFVFSKALATTGHFTQQQYIAGSIFPDSRVFLCSSPVFCTWSFIGVFLSWLRLKAIVSLCRGLSCKPICRVRPITPAGTGAGAKYLWHPSALRKQLCIRLMRRNPPHPDSRETPQRHVILIAKRSRRVFLLYPPFWSWC